MPTMPKSKIGLPPKPAPSMPPPAGFVVPPPSPSINEGVMTNTSNDPSVATALATIAECRTCVERAHTQARAIHSDDALTETARHMKAEAYAAAAIRPALMAVDRQAAALANEIKSLEAKTHAPPPTRDAIAAEVRARLSQMKPGARSATIFGAIAAGDDSVVAAVLGAPAFLSGLEPLEIENFRARWAAARHPEIVERLKLLRTPAEHLDRAGALSLAYQSKCSDPATLAAARANKERIEKALAAASGNGSIAQH